MHLENKSEFTLIYTVFRMYSPAVANIKAVYIGI